MSQKGDLSSIQHKLYEAEKDNSALRVESASLKNDLEYSNAKVERLTVQNNEIKERNKELEDRVRIQIDSQEYLKKIEDLKLSL